MLRIITRASGGPVKDQNCTKASETKATNAASATATYNRGRVPGFVLHNLIAAYELGRRASLQLNVSNLFDKEYFTQLRSTSTTSGWVNPGVGRTATLALNVNF